MMYLGSFTLSILDQETDDWNAVRRAVRHYRVKNTDAGGCYVATKRLFNTIVDLVAHYKSRPTFVKNLIHDRKRSEDYCDPRILIFERHSQSIFASPNNSSSPH